MNLHQRLKEERERLGHSQTAFAAIAGASKHSQINWEKGPASPNALDLASWAEAGVDVLYVITGQRDQVVPALDAAERVLLDSYRRCTAEAKANLIQTAALLSAGLPGVQAEKSSGRAKKPEGGQVLKNTGDRAVQIGSAGGSVSVKKGR